MHPSSLQIRASLLETRQRLAEGRERVQARHRRGLRGWEVCARLTSLVDTVVQGIFEEALFAVGEPTALGLRRKVALVALGGYGRRQLAPFSDVDLMILHSGRADDNLVQFAKRMTADVFDVGLTLGHSVRTVAQALRLARSDPVIATSFVEARPIAGEQDLYEEFSARFAKLVVRRHAAFISAAIDSRRQEQAKFGETVYLLAPHVKRSRGGLRDVHLLRWLAYFRYRIADPDPLRTAGRLSKLDHHRLTKAEEFLLHLRNEMHFEAGRANDVLDRGEQVRIAGVFAYRGTEGMLPVEHLMKDYFWHTTQVAYLTRRFAAALAPTRSRWPHVAPPTQIVDGDFRMDRQEISATPQGLDKLTSHLERVLRLVELATRYDRGIAPATWSAVYLAAPTLPRKLTPDALARFEFLLASRARLGDALRRLHELGVLERIVPAFTHARCLLQFNDYHKYTVDEHCIRAVECATQFADRGGPLAEAYAAVGDKPLLHLALLIHDLGKGHPEDHSEVGRKIAVSTAQRLGLDATRTATLVFLVHQHLLLSHRTFRRDTSGEGAIVELAVSVGSPEVLRMLFVLTCADLAAVGPDVLTEWKVSLITDLYQRTLAYLTRSDDAKSPDAQGLREAVRAMLDGGAEELSLERLDALPLRFLEGRSAEDVAGALIRWQALPGGAAEAWGEYRSSDQTVEFVAAISHGVGQGVFYRLAGTLAANEWDILSATIDTLPGNLLLTRFWVTDGRATVPPSVARIRGVTEKLIDAVGSDQPPHFRSMWGDATRGKRPTATTASRVEFDNATSEKHTIIEVFTFDRRGLLYEIGRALHGLELSIRVAKIGTYLDQVVDVFYVTDRRGDKIGDDGRLAEIRSTLLALLSQRKG